MNSDIIKILKDNDRIFIAIEVEFSGRSLYFAPVNYQLEDIVFDGILVSQPTIGSTFDLNNIKYSTQNATFKVSNKDRLQDLELKEDFDSATGKVYLCAHGLTWDQITNSLMLFKGAFRAENYDDIAYTFRIIEEGQYAFDTLPKDSINDATWPNHRKFGGGGSVSGKMEPVIFGNWSKGIPLYCVETTTFVYIVGGGGVMASTDADYTAASVNVYDKDGAVIAASNYTFSHVVDGAGNICPAFTFTSDQSDYEPLTCSIQGVANEDGLIEHPADIISYIKGRHSTVDFDMASLRDYKAKFFSYKFACYIKSSVPGLRLLNRILCQCMCGKVSKLNGQTGIMVFDPDADPMMSLNLDTDKPIGTLTIGRTPENLICNNLVINFGYNPKNGSWDKRLVLNRYNNNDAKQSYYEYGDLPQQAFDLTDVQQESVALACGSHYLRIFAMRHNTVECKVQHYIGMQIDEGSAVNITTALGPGGWVNEKCILLDRKVSKDYVTLRFWRVNT